MAETDTPFRRFFLTRVRSASHMASDPPPPLGADPSLQYKTKKTNR